MSAKTDNGEKNEIPPHIVNIELTHYQQRYNWDCGISCVLMILPEEKRRNLIDNFTQICSDEGFNKSTWSIDLCYLLLRYEIQHIYCTITLGVHPDYVNQNFYDKILFKDEQRVTKRFADATLSGLSVRKTSLRDEELRRHLAERGPVILLTNANLLQCETCHSSHWLAAELKACLPWKIGGGSGTSAEYHGHYIVLCGYNMAQQCYMYRNPSYKDKICSMTFTAMEAARKSHGTDEDVILVFKRSWV